MYILEPGEMKTADKYAINDLGIGEAYLMMNAAKAVYQEIIKIDASSVSVLAGKGNNGTDALILADLLIQGGYRTKIFILAEYAEMGDIAKKTLETLKGRNDGISPYNECSDIKADIVVDGLFGTGFYGSMPEKYIDAINKINRTEAYIIAVDIPSGLDARTGMVLETCVKADLTVSFGAAKTGFFQNEGPVMIGRLKVKDIGIPSEAFSIIGIKRYLIDGDLIKKFYHERKIASNKGDHGKALIIAGSEDMPGAGVLCCKAAYRTGAGYVYYLTDSSNKDAYTAAVPEAIYKRELDLEDIDSVAIGPGTGVSDKTRDLVNKLLQSEDINVILDADALNSISDPEVLKTAKARVAITPHPRELSRLTGISTDAIQRDRIRLCRQFAIDHKTVTLLKGYNTVISDEAGNIYLNATGNNSLAKAGSGDILTGMIAGFSARSDLLEAAVLSVYLHGYCADIFVRKHSHFSLLASEIVDHLPEAMAENGLL